MNPVYSQAATGQAASYNPAMATAQNSQAAQAQAAQAQAALVNPTQNDSYLKQYESLLNTTMQPQFQAQNQSLQDSLAARGISSSGSAAYLQNQLSGQQASALAAATSPLVQQGYGYTQADIAANQSNQQQTGLYNAGNQQQTGLYNAGNQQQTNLANQNAQNQFSLSNQNALNTAGQTNSGYSQQANLFNAGNQQQTNLANQNAGMTAGATNAGYQQQANLANQGAANSASATNAGYYDQALTGNANAYNSYLQQLNQQAYGLQNSELSAYLNSFGPNTGVTSAMNTGLAGTQGAYSNALSGAQNQQNSMLGTLGTYAAMGA
jgi:hypothetical protein